MMEPLTLEQIVQCGEELILEERFTLRQSRWLQIQAYLDQQQQKIERLRKLVKNKFWSQEELDEAKREAERVDAKLNWTGTKEGG